MFLGGPCAKLFLLLFAQCLHPVEFFLWLSSLPPFLLLVNLTDRSLLFFDGGDGDQKGKRKVDGDRGQRLTCLASLGLRSFFFARPCLTDDTSLSVVVEAFALLSELSERYFLYAASCWTNCYRRVMPWLTISANSPRVFAFLRFFASSTTARILMISLMESVSWVWLKRYFATILPSATLISMPHICWDAHSVLANITTALRSMCTLMPYTYDFLAIVTKRSTLVTTVSLQLKIIPAMFMNCRLMSVASGLSTPSVMAEMS